MRGEWDIKIYYLNINGNANKGSGIKSSLIKELRKYNPDVIVLTEFTYKNEGNDLLIELKKEGYKVKVSSEDIHKNYTCLVLIGCKTQIKDLGQRPSVLENRFLSVELNDEINIIGVHVPPAYPYKKDPKNPFVEMNSLYYRIVNEIEPFRAHINSVQNNNGDKKTIIVGDFNPYNKNNSIVKGVLSMHHNLILTDNKEESEKTGFTTLFNGIRSQKFGKQLDFVFASASLNNRFISLEISEVESEFTDHKRIVFQLIK